MSFETALGVVQEFWFLFQRERLCQGNRQGFIRKTSRALRSTSKGRERGREVRSELWMVLHCLYTPL